MNIEQAHKILDYANKRLIEEIHSDDVSSINYWRGYADGIRRIIKEMKNNENQ